MQALVQTLCIWQSDATPFCENYAKLCFFFKKSALFGQYFALTQFSRLGPAMGGTKFQ